MLYVDDFDRISDYNKSHPNLKKLFENPRGHWFCKKQKNLTSSVRRLLARAKDSTIVLVLYFIPNRDLDGHSKGGAQTPEEYLEFVNDFAAGIGDKSPIIILEPDALAHAITHHTDTSIRIDLIINALKILTKTHARVYVDIGHARWIDWSIAADTLKTIPSELYTGFSINVSNFIPLDECLIYGQLISQITGKSFVIDTSRNGNQTYQNDWCNPSSAKLGHPPTLDTKIRNVDGFLWIKIPGESDGLCNGGPKAGKFWANYANILLHQV